MPLESYSLSFAPPYTHTHTPMRLGHVCLPSFKERKLRLREENAKGQAA